MLDVLESWLGPKVCEGVMKEVEIRKEIGGWKDLGGGLKRAASLGEPVVGMFVEQPGDQ